MIREVYLDNSATTKPFDDILEGFGPEMGNNYGNPSSLHKKGLEAEAIIKKSREVIAGSLGVNSGDIFFTSGGTESNNIAILGNVMSSGKRTGTIITSSIEHASVLSVFRYLEKSGINVEYLPVDKYGVIMLDILEKHLKSSPVSLVSVMHVNNEVGTVQPLSEIIMLKNRYGFALHVDAVQSYCKMNVQEIAREVDMVSISGHKVNCIKGIGALYKKRGTRLEPLMHGGGQQEFLRPGTENVPGIWAFGKAVEINISKKYGDYYNVRKIKEYFIRRLLEEIPGASLNGTMEAEKSAPHIANIALVGIPAEVMVHALEQYGIYSSTVSACSSRKRELSHVLNAMGVERKLIQSSLRFSFSIFNNKDDIDYCIDVLKKQYSTLAKSK